MRLADMVVGVLAVLMGTYAILGAREMEYDGIYGPGPGFFPIWLGGVMLLLGIGLLVSIFRSRGRTKVKAFDLDRRRALRVGIAVGSLAASVWLYQYLGFMVGFGLFVVTALVVLDRLPWYKVAAVAVLMPVGFWGIFSKGLNIDIPKGIFGG